MIGILENSNIYGKVRVLMNYTVKYFQIIKYDCNAVVYKIKVYVLQLLK